MTTKSKGALTIPRQYTSTALALPEGLAFDDWLSIGTTLQKAGAAVQWWLGDGWCFGDAQYGERAAQAMDPDFPWAIETVMNAGSVARRIPTSRRREVLSFGHHAAVAYLEPAHADRLLAEAERNHWSRAKLRAEIRALKAGPEDFREAFAQWAERVGAEFERIKADTELLDKIKRGELELVGFEGGRPVVRDQQREIRERIDAALSGSGENKALRAWQWRRVDRDAKHGGWSVVRSSDETPEAVKRALELKFGVEVEVKAVATANGA